MKFLLYLLACSFMMVQTGGGSQQFGWVKPVGSVNNDQGTHVQLDSKGNLYQTGHFSGTIDMDASAAVYTLTGSTNPDIFIAKHRHNGDLVWAKAFSGTGHGYGQETDVDAKGNVYSVGHFNDVTDFDPGSGVYQLTAQGVRDAFVSKLDSSGNLVWVYRLGSSGDDIAYSINTDTAGNSYIGGYFSGTVDFNPGFGTNNLTASGEEDAFLLKLDASGGFVWAKQIGGTGADQTIGVHLAGNSVVVSGFFSETINPSGQNGQSISSSGEADAFVAKYDSQTGNFQWLRKAGGTNWDEAYHLVTDSSGTIYATGAFEGTASFGSGSGSVSLISKGGRDGFVQKISASGNLIWAKGFGSTGDDLSHDVAVDQFRDVYLTGFFVGTADFDPSAGVQNVSSNGMSDVFILKLDSSGNYQYNSTFGSTGEDVSWAIAMKDYTEIFTAGYYAGTVDFDPGTATSNATSNGGSDAYLHLLRQATVLPSQLLSFTARHQQANVSLSWNVRQENDRVSFDVEKSYDGRNFRRIRTVDAPFAAYGNGLADYRCTDEEPMLAGDRAVSVLYRLKQMDEDGNTSYSAVEKLSREQAQPTVRIFPNPVTKGQALQVTVATETWFVLKDMNGRTVFHRNLSAGRQSVQMPALAAGQYVVQWKDGSQLILITE